MMIFPRKNTETVISTERNQMNQEIEVMMRERKKMICRRKMTENVIRIKIEVQNTREGKKMIYRRKKTENVIRIKIGVQNTREGKKMICRRKKKTENVIRIKIELQNT